MMNKIKNNVAFYAALLNLVASGFFLQSFRRLDDILNVNNVFGVLFFAASVVLWTVYIVLYFTLAVRQKRKS